MNFSETGWKEMKEELLLFWRNILQCIFSEYASDFVNFVNEKWAKAVCQWLFISHPHNYLWLNPGNIVPSSYSVYCYIFTWHFTWAGYTCDLSLLQVCSYCLCVYFVVMNSIVIQPRAGLASRLIFMGAWMSKRSEKTRYILSIKCVNVMWWRNNESRG